MIEESIKEFLERGGKIEIIRPTHTRRGPAIWMAKWDTGKNNKGIKVAKKTKGNQGSRGTKFSILKGGINGNASPDCNPRNPADNG